MKVFVKPLTRLITLSAIIVLIVLDKAGWCVIPAIVLISDMMQDWRKDNQQF